MLTLGLTGGIGSGKSTVSSLLADLGATVVDADLVAREVLAPGTPALSTVVDAFGSAVLRDDGSLDRSALAAVVFADDVARSRLDGIVHPLIGARTQQLIEEAKRRGTQILVHDVPLLVEAGLAPGYHLVAVVDAPVEVRLARLRQRGLPEEKARARMAAQADEASRRAAADVWLDNGGTPEQLAGQVRALHEVRLAPYARNLADGRPAVRDRTARTAPSPVGPMEVARLHARLSYLCRGVPEASIGPGALPVSDDVIRLEVEVPAWEVAEALPGLLAAGGFPEADEVGSRATGPAPAARRHQRLHRSADPARPADVHVRASGT